LIGGALSVIDKAKGHSRKRVPSYRYIVARG